MGGGGGSNRRLSLGGNVHQTPRPDSSHSTRATPNSRPINIKKDDPGALSTGEFQDPPCYAVLLVECKIRNYKPHSQPQTIFYDSMLITK